LTTLLKKSPDLYRVQQNRYGWITVEQVEDGLTVDAFMELA
jgi:hypothetical protein